LNCRKKKADEETKRVAKEKEARGVNENGLTAGKREMGPLGSSERLRRCEYKIARQRRGAGRKRLWGGEKEFHNEVFANWTFLRRASRRFDMQGTRHLSGKK